MIHTHEKTEILQSLDTLDAQQAEMVLGYIKGLLGQNKNEQGYKALKQQAMIEIREALATRGTHKPSIDSNGR